MARVQLVIPDNDRDQFVHQAKSEGLTLSAWLRLAAQEKLTRETGSKKFQTVEEIRAFYKVCDDSVDLEHEPDWEDHKKVISKSKSSGSSNT